MLFRSFFKCIWIDWSRTSPILFVFFWFCVCFFFSLTHKPGIKDIQMYLWSRADKGRHFGYLRLGLAQKSFCSLSPALKWGSERLGLWSIIFQLLVCLFSFIIETESTDDDKIVSYHWEELKGPLREEKVSSDTAILTLTNLVPGNYTFRWVIPSSVLVP